VVGPLDADAPVLVDAAGAVSPAGAGWCLDWWIGADDRWYFPSREPSVRQRRPSAAPVVETAVRIPSGDATQVVYAVPGSPSIDPATAGSRRRQLTVVEFGNDSPVPVALAVAIRPYPVVDPDVGEPSDQIGEAADVPAPSITIDRLDDRTLVVSDTVIRLPRPPSQLAASDEHDLLEGLERGEALSWSGPVDGLEANAVVLYPLPHRTSLRLVFGPATFDHGASGDPPELDPASVPSPDSVRRGWDAVLDGGGRFEFPDDGLTGAAAAARARLLLTPGTRLERLRGELELPGDSLGRRLRTALGHSDRSVSEFDDHPGGTSAAAGRVLAALARSGRWSETRAALELIADSFPVAADPTTGPDLVAGIGVAAATVAACSRDERSNRSGAAPGRIDLLERLVEPTVQLVKLLERKQGPNIDRSRAGLGLLVQALGQYEAAAELRASVTQWAATDDPAVALGAEDLETVTRLMERAGGVGRWGGGVLSRIVHDDLDVAAGFWLAARSLLFHEQPGGGAGDVPVVDLLPRFPAAWRGGGLDVHKAPTLGGLVSFAVRWHGARPALLWEVASAGPVMVTCSSLDPGWSTAEAGGEVLLAGSTQGLADAPAPGDSFQ
jgi:hypothetical protein